MCPLWTEKQVKVVLRSLGGRAERVWRLEKRTHHPNNYSMVTKYLDRTAANPHQHGVRTDKYI